MRFGLIAFAGFVSAVLVGCSDTDDFNPVGKKRDAASELQDIPCDGANEGLRVIVGSDRDIYVCEYDPDEFEYVWVNEGIESSNSTKSSAGNSSSSRYSSSYSSSSYSEQEVRQKLLNINLSKKDDIFNPRIEYGSMEDPRDGKVYRTVEVAGQVWMAENLNYSERGHCFNDISEYCDLMGRLYTRNEAMDICPDGWHIPTENETEALLEAADGNIRNLQSANGWSSDTTVMTSGNNSLGMSFVGTGNYPEMDYPTLGLYAKMWIDNKSSNVYLLFRAAQDEVKIFAYDGIVYASARCIKD